MKKVSVFFFTMISCLTILSINQTEATLLTYDFTGTITSFRNGGGDDTNTSMETYGIDVGDRFSGMFALDTNNPNTDEGGYYNPLNSAFVNLGSRTLLFSENEYYLNGANLQLFSMVPDSNGIFINDFNFFVDDGYLWFNRLNSQPFQFSDIENILNMTNFSGQLGLFGFATDPLYSYFGDLYGSIDTLSRVKPVPEPSTILLMGSGLAALLGYGRRRFKK